MSWAHHHNGFGFRIERCKVQPNTHIFIYSDGLMRKERQQVANILMAGVTSSVTGRHPVSGEFIYETRVRCSLDSFVANHLRDRGFPIPVLDRKEAI